MREIPTLGKFRNYFPTLEAKPRKKNLSQSIKQMQYHNHNNTFIENGTRDPKLYWWF